MLLYTSFKGEIVNLGHRKRPTKKWTDMTWQDTGLTLLIPGRNASERNIWRIRKVKESTELII